MFTDAPEAYSQIIQRNGIQEKIREANANENTWVSCIKMV